MRKVMENAQYLNFRVPGPIGKALLSHKSTSTRHLLANEPRWKIKSPVECLAPKYLLPITRRPNVTGSLVYLLYQAKSCNVELVIKTKFSQFYELSSFSLTLSTIEIQGRDNLHIPSDTVKSQLEGIIKAL